MRSTVPPSLVCVPPVEAEFAYLLLGDLWGLLEETPDLVTSRWLLATLDWLLVHRVRLDTILGLRTSAAVAWSEIDTVDAQFYAKLQRLRDRVAHRKPYALLANEVRCDLRDLLTPV